MGELRGALYCCGDPCEEDRYEEEVYEDIRYYILNKKCPEHYGELTAEVRDKKLRELRTTYFYYRITICNRKTAHLWKLKM
jgi:hypothetical protein